MSLRVFASAFLCAAVAEARGGSMSETPELGFLRPHLHRAVKPQSLWEMQPSRSRYHVAKELAQYIEEGRAGSTNRYWQTPLLMPEQEKPICMDSGNGSRAVPRIYLLGQKKCGTTSASFDMKLAGAQGAFKTDPWKKELHLFDDLCSWRVAKKWGEAEWTGKAIPGVCPDALTTAERQVWLQHHPFYECDNTTRGVFSDLTPLNMRLVGLPGMMSQLYGGDAQKLAFVVFLRDPLARFQSGFYSSRNGSDWSRTAPATENFGAHVAGIRAKVDAYTEADMEGADLDYSIDEFYRSLYSRNMMPWVGAFEPQQFMIVPMKYYFESADTKLGTLAAIASQFGAHLVPELAIHNTHEFNQGVHASVDDDLDVEARNWLNAHFDADTAQLAELLASKLDAGLTIAGYTGPSDAKSIRTYLEAHW